MKHGGAPVRGVRGPRPLPSPIEEAVLPLAALRTIVIVAPTAGAGILFIRLFATRKGGVNKLEDQTYRIRVNREAIARASVLPRKAPR
jgi:hypothetical protein